MQRQSGCGDEKFLMIWAGKDTVRITEEELLMGKKPENWENRRKSKGLKGADVG